MLYELRTYTMYPDKLDAIQERFSEHTLSIFKRLGMKVYDFWVDAGERPKLYYIMEYRSMEERTQLWEKFRHDPEWLQIKARSEAGGPIVQSVEETFMHRAAYFERQDRS